MIGSFGPKKRRDYLDVDWVELGCRGWDIDDTGALLLDETEWNNCHLDRTTLDILGCGDGAWWVRVMHDLATAQVPGLEQFRPWRVVGRFDAITHTTGSIP